MKEDVSKSKSLSFKYRPNYSEIKKTEFKASYVFQVRRPPPTEKEAIVNYEFEEVIYEPKTDEIRAAYDELLNLIRQPLADQPLSILGFAAHKIVEILKDDTYKRQENKKKHIDMLLNPISDHVFDQLLSISKLLTDFHDVPHGNVPISF